VPVGATDAKNNLLTALNNAIFTLRRYVEYYQRQQTDRPELLLPVINEIREARHDSPYPDSCFFETSLATSPDFCADLLLPTMETVDDNDVEIHARRFRLMYQVGLLGLIRNENMTTSRRLLARAARGFSRLCKGEALASLWCLVTIVTDVMQEKQLPVEKNRKRLFMKIERYSRELVQVGRVAMGKTAPHSVFRELVYILYRSGSQKHEVTRILDAYQLTPAAFTEEEHAGTSAPSVWAGGADVLRSFSEAINEETQGTQGSAGYCRAGHHRPGYHRAQYHRRVVGTGR